ncbi:hypothetical protein L7F22_018547 [Adiantum nelumboides]|nr:hypothetical protein [Adiantum nelumboides]
MEIAAALQNGMVPQHPQIQTRPNIDSLFLHNPLFTEDSGASTPEHDHFVNGTTTLVKSNFIGNHGAQSYASKAMGGSKSLKVEGMRGDKGKAKEHVPQGDPGLVIRIEALDDWYKQLQERVIQIEALDDWYKQLQERVVIGLCHGIQPFEEGFKIWIAQTWKNKNFQIDQVQYLPYGYYLFFFKDANSALQVVSQGQWLIRSTPMLVFKWFPGFNPRGPKPSRVPVWIDFLKLSMEFLPWLTNLANLVGNVMGQENRGDINPKWDPQVLVEVDTSQTLVIVEVPIKNSLGYLLHLQKVVYRNLPNACFSCMKQAHLIKDCPELKPDSLDGTKGNKAHKTDAQGFQAVNRKNWSKNNEYNKSASKKYENHFQPLLTNVFDPCYYVLPKDQVEEPEGTSEHTQQDPKPCEGFPTQEAKLPSQTNLKDESKFTSDNEGEFIPNTQQGKQDCDVDLFFAQLEHHDQFLKEQMSQQKITMWMLTCPNLKRIRSQSTSRARERRSVPKICEGHVRGHRLHRLK